MMGSPRPPVAALAGVSKTYATGGAPVHALDRVDLEIAAGEFVAVTGRSGSGKTTLLSVIGGLSRPEGGMVRLDGQDIWSLPDRDRSLLRSRHIGFAFQFASLIPTLTALENVLLPAAFSGNGDAWRDAGLRDRARLLLARLEVAELADRYPAELSGGEQRRVAVARALVTRPALVLADEPTGDLDAESEALVFDLLSEARASGSAVVLVTHEAALAARAQRHLVMARGALGPAPVASAMR